MNKVSKVVYLDASLVAEEIDMLPVATVECDLVPVFGDTSTSAQAHDIQIWEHPTRSREIVRKLEWV